MQNVQAQKSLSFVGGDIPNKVLRFRAGRGHCCLDLRSASFWVCLVLLHLSFLSDLLCLLLICESSKSIFLFCTCGISQQAGSAKSSLVFLRFFLSLFFSFYHFVFCSELSVAWISNKPELHHRTPVSPRWQIQEYIILFVQWNCVVLIFITKFAANEEANQKEVAMLQPFTRWTQSIKTQHQIASIINTMHEKRRKYEFQATW